MAKANKAPSKQAMRGKGGRADVIDTPEGRERREAAIATVIGRRAKVIKAPVARRCVNDNNPMREMERLVEGMLKDAADVIRRMSVSSGSYPASTGSAWPPVVRDYWESAKYSIPDIPRVVPSMKEFDAAIDVMRALMKLPERERKIVAAKAFGSSYRQIAKEFHCSYVTIRSEHRLGLVTLGLIIKNSS